MYKYTHTYCVWTVQNYEKTQCLHLLHQHAITSLFGVTEYLYKTAPMLSLTLSLSNNPQTNFWWRWWWWWWWCWLLWLVANSQRCFDRDWKFLVCIPRIIIVMYYTDIIQGFFTVPFCVNTNWITLPVGLWTWLIFSWEKMLFSTSWRLVKSTTTHVCGLTWTSYALFLWERESNLIFLSSN